MALRPLTVGFAISLSAVSAFSVFANSANCQSPIDTTSISSQLNTAYSLFPTTPSLQNSNHAVMAVPVPTDSREMLWSGEKIDFNELKHLGALPDKEILRSFKEDYGIQIGVAKTNADDIKSLQRSLGPIKSSSSSPSVNPEVLDLSHAEKNAALLENENSDPVVVVFVEAFKKADGYGEFIPKGANPYQSGQANANTILFKDFATRTTMLHEFTHFLIAREREKLGKPNPWLGPTEEERQSKGTLKGIKLEYQRYLATSGEELDVHRLTIDARNELGLTQDKRGLANALVVYRQKLDEVKKANASMAARLKDITMNGVDPDLKELADLKTLVDTTAMKIQASEKWYQSKAPEIEALVGRPSTVAASLTR